MYKNKYLLQSVDASKLNISHLLSLSVMFENCYSLKLVKIPSNTAHIQDISNMFRNCKSLEFVNLSTFKHDSLQIARNVFDGCDSLYRIKCTRDMYNKLDLPNNWHYDQLLETAIKNE